MNLAGKLGIADAAFVHFLLDDFADVNIFKL